jgi:hypothetical protein
MQGANVRVEEDEEARGEQQRNNSRERNVRERQETMELRERNQAKMKRDPGRLHYNQQKQGSSTLVSLLFAWCPSFFFKFTLAAFPLAGTLLDKIMMILAPSPSGPLHSLLPRLSLPSPLFLLRGRRRGSSDGSNRAG